jgi:alanine dehydrogenase
MIIGVPKEIKVDEFRVGVTPQGVKGLAEGGHRVIVEKSAGAGSGFSDEDYESAGAEISDKERLFADAGLIIKVKEPLADEYHLLREGQALFTFLHLASNPGLLKILLKKNISAFGYETLEVDGTLPLLRPMSEIAGKMAPFIAAFYLQKFHGGEGLLFTGTEGVHPANVLILGAGVVGMSALKVAHGMGAQVTIVNRGEDKLRQVDEIYKRAVRTLGATAENIETAALAADVLIGAVYVTGSRTPKLISRELVSRMRNGAVIVDVSVDQGGCIETTRPTTHDNPVYIVDGVVHYTVANMPGAYPRTSTFALTAKTIEYIKILAKNGIENAFKENPAIRTALNTFRGEIMHKAVAESMRSIL